MARIKVRWAVVRGDEALGWTPSGYHVFAVAAWSYIGRGCRVARAAPILAVGVEL